MKVGDLIYPVMPSGMISLDPRMQPYLMQVIEVAKTGINVIILSGPHIGCEVFYPDGNNRRWRIVSRI